MTRSRSPLVHGRQASIANDTKFHRLVQDAVAHVFDPIYLQTHALARLLVVESESTAPTGRALQTLLVEAIASLKPLKETPANVKAWRRYRILQLRYVDGWEIADVLRELAIGRSEYFREHRRALNAVASLVGEQFQRISDGAATQHEFQDKRDGGADKHVVETPHNLPLALTSFVGRDQEMNEATQALKRTRLMTLTGTGGCGKTRLALEIARQMVEDYQDGVWFVDLAPVVDQTTISHVVARAIGFHPESNCSGASQVIDFLSSRRVLLLLDNCEHLIDGCASFVEKLLQAAPDLCVLATSREALSVAGEVQWPVSPLTVPATSDPIEHIVASPAVRLFVDRVQSVVPGFSLTEENSGAVVDLCRRLDGIPLTLELAAARLSAFSPEQLAARIDHRFGLLSSDRHTAIPRQQTLEATVDWSYQLLTDREQRLFNRLSVFAGGWTLDAAEAVCSGGGINGMEVPRILAHLVGKSLVLAEPDSHGDVRYRMLETLSTYAWQKLVESGEKTAIVASHAEHFRARVEQLDWLGLSWTTEPRPAWLEREHDNLRTALNRMCLDDDMDRALHFGAALGSTWLRSGHIGEARETLERVLSLRSPDEISNGRAWALFALAHLVARHGDYDEVDRLYDESLSVFRVLEDRFGEAWVLTQQATMAFMRGDLTLAREKVSQSESTWNPHPETDESDRRATLRYTQRLARGYITVYQGDFAATRAVLEPLLAEQRAAAVPASSYLLGVLGQAFKGQGHLDRALRHYREALINGRDNDDIANMAYTLERIAGLVAALEQYERAAQITGFALSLRKRVQAAPGVPQAALREREMSRARQALGEERYAALVAAGEELSFDEGLAEALLVEDPLDS